MKRALVYSYILIAFLLFPTTAIFSDNELTGRKQHYFTIAAKGEISVNFPGGSLESGSIYSPTEITQTANTDNTEKILIARHRSSNGDDRSLPYTNNNTNFIIDVTEAVYNPETDQVIIRRVIQNVDYINQRSYPQSVFIAKWYLLKEAIIKSKK